MGEVGGFVGEALFGRTPDQANVTVSTPAATPEEVAIQQEMLALMKQDREVTPYEQKMMTYSEAVADAMTTMLPQLKEMSSMEYELFKRQVAELDSPLAQLQRQVATAQAEWQLARIEEAKNLGAITGDLSDAERNALDTMASNAITSLTENVNRELTDVMGKTIASLVDRGVLQGDVGAAEMADVNKRALELVLSGSRDIESQKMAQIISLGEAQKDRQLQLASMVQSGVLTAGQMNQALAGSLMNYAGGQGKFAQQFAQSADQYSTQLSQQWDTSRTQAGLQAWGLMAGLRGNEAQRQLQAAIATGSNYTSAYNARVGGQAQIGSSLGPAMIKAWG